MLSLRRILDQLRTIGRTGETEEQIARRVAALHEATYSRPYCTTCQGTGSLWRTVWEDAEEPWSGRGHPRHDYAGKCPDCSKDPHEHLQRRLAASGLNPLWRERYSFATYNPHRQPKMAPIMRQLRAWAEHPAHTLVLAGLTGRGKTHLVIAAAIVCVENGLYVRFTTVAGLLDLLRASMGEDGYAETKQVYVEEPNVLVLDDLKAEHQTDWVEAEMDKIIAYRILHERPMLITTNAGPGQLSERLASRFRDASLCSVLKCDGEDIRPTMEAS